MKKVKFINSYSFIFSARPGTPAFNLKKLMKILQKKINIFQNISKKKKYIEKLIN